MGFEAILVDTRVMHTSRRNTELNYWATKDRLSQAEMMTKYRPERSRVLVHYRSCLWEQYMINSHNSSPKIMHTKYPKSMCESEAPCLWARFQEWATCVFMSRQIVGRQKAATENHIQGKYTCSPWTPQALFLGHVLNVEKPVLKHDTKNSFFVHRL